MDLFHNLSILSWNIRGAFGRSTKRHVRDIINTHHPSLFLVYETHGPFAKAEKMWGVLGYKPVFIEEARGHSGGIWVLSCRDDLTYSLIHSMSQAITFSIRKKDSMWYCTAAYGSPTFTIRCDLWQHLKTLRRSIAGPWVLIGDLNEIASSNEVSGGNFLPSRAHLMYSMMDDCDFMDLHTIGGLFTWRKNVQRGVHVRKKLDRCMADVDWRLSFPHALVEVLHQHNSDHNPLLLSCVKASSKKSKLFHFQAAWIKHPDYENVVATTWTNSYGDASTKLLHVRDQSLVFNKHVFGNVFKNKRILEARIRGVHRELDYWPTSDMIRLEKDLQQQYNQILAHEEILWFQKSREKWVKLGNKNTKFFHTQTIIHRRRNKVAGLNIDGIWCSDEEALKREALSYFKKLFQNNDHCDPHALNLQQVPKISNDLYASITQPVTMEEVKASLFSMGSYKAPGPDGFQPIFFKTYWHIIGNDVWHLVSNAFMSGSIEKHLAETLIVPIPKIDDPQSFKDFRPISLCNVLLKIISKILVWRIRPFLDDIVGPLQSSFIPKRGTSDNALIAQEIVHHMHKKKGKSDYIMFKIDFEKAYDRVDWGFLRLTLTDFGFPDHTIQLIMSCITSSTLSLKWNGEKLESFAPSKGLRQGDPISPYLFVLCMEKLALLIQDKIQEGKWLPVRISPQCPAISHLFFADDCLLFTKSKTSQVKLVQEVLKDFCAASGMKVNIQKSRFFPSRNVPRTKISKFQSIINFQHTQAIGQYLGFPIITGRATKADFSHLMDRINSKLTG